jgi:hypothetical protein
MPHLPRAYKPRPQRRHVLSTNVLLLASQEGTWTLPQERAAALLAVNPNALNGCTLHFAQDDETPTELRGRTKTAVIMSSLPHSDGLLLVQGECSANDGPILALVNIHTCVTPPPPPIFQFVPIKSTCKLAPLFQQCVALSL